MSRQLAAHLDGQLARPKAQQIDLHLSECANCRTELEQVRRGMRMVEHLTPVEAPEAIWSSIDAMLQNRRSLPATAISRWRWALAAIVILAVAAAAYWRLAQPAGRSWEVVRLDGTPLVGTKAIRGAGKIGAGEWIETDARSRAMVKVGEIGSVEIAPNTRIRVVTVRPDEHRLALARGEVRAKISAPPKLFFVETASGTAIDLGCEYALSTDETGFGLLRVTKGWVSFQWKGLESLVPAGASCQTRPQAGPGIPYFDDAPASLKQALRAGISREQALKLDPETLNRWKEELAWTW